MSAPSTPTSPAAELYEIRMITEKDSDLLLDHLRKFFFKDEPLNTAVKLIDFENSTCIELEEYSLKTIKEGTSLMAVAASGNVIGVCLNGSVKHEDPEELDECPNPKFAKILKFLEYAGEEATKTITQKFPEINKIMFVKIISTDSAWRGKGIAKVLMERTRIIGREQGFGLMRVDCTSHFSARAIARLGFKCVYKLKYEDYKENGEPVFVPEHPHNEFSVYVQGISST